MLYFHVNRNKENDFHSMVKNGLEASGGQVLVKLCDQIALLATFRGGGPVSHIFYICVNAEDGHRCQF